MTWNGREIDEDISLDQLYVVTKNKNHKGLYSNNEMIG